MGKREPTQLTRLLRAMALTLAIALAFNGRVLSLWAASMRDSTMRAFFSGFVEPLVRISGAHGLDGPEKRMNGAFKLALAGSSDGSSARLGRAKPDRPGAPSGTPAPSGSPGLSGTPGPSGSPSPSESSGGAPPGALSPRVNPDGWVNASDTVFYPDYYRSFTFSSVEANPVSGDGVTDLLFIGDSLLGSMAGSLKRWAPEHPEYSIQLEYGISSALVQSVYCDWQKRLEDILVGTRFDCVVVFLGANDGIGIHTGGVDLPFDSEEWVAEYQARVRKLLGAMEGKAGRVYWLGTPPMRKPGYRERMKRVNELVAEVCAEFPRAEFVDLSPLLGDESGRYRAAMSLGGETKIVRADDGIHFSQAGAGLLTEFVFGRIERDLRPSGREGGPPPGEGGEAAGRLSWGYGPARAPSP